VNDRVLFSYADTIIAAFYVQLDKPLLQKDTTFADFNNPQIKLN